MSINKRTFVLLILSIVWAIIIFILCTMPASGLPKIKLPYIDKVVHFGVFFVQSVLLSFLFSFRTRKSYFQIILLSTLMAFVYGGIIEILQNNVFDRTGDVYDLIADVLGGFAGAVLYPILLRFFNLLSKKQT